MAVERPSAEVSLADDGVRVEADGLDKGQLQLYFEAILGGQRIDGGWLCPLRRQAGNELVVKIAAQLSSRGYEVSTSGGPADQALERAMDRMRSFERSRDAASALLGLNPGTEMEALIEEEAVLADLDQSGWNSTQRSLLPHQRRAVVHALTAANAANFSVPGAGKTATALAVLLTHLAKGTIDTAIVVGPLSCFRPWEREAETALPGVLNVKRVRGMQATSRAHIYRAVDHGDLLLLSYATAAHDRPELQRLCDRLGTMLIVDESHRVKRFRGGEWAPALVELAEHAKVRMILTGTPMPQAPTDLWSQFNILWPGEEATGTRGAFEASANANFNTAVSRLEPFFTRTPKSELGLTEPRFCEPEIPMAPLQADIYQLIVEQLRGRIPDSASWQEKIERLRRARPIRLIQVASNPDLLNENDGFFDIPAIENPGATLMQRLETYRQQNELPAKFEWALGFLRRIKEADEKCVVWTTFIRNIDQFEALVATRLGGPVFTVDGRVPAAETADPEINAANEDDDHSGEEIDETREKRIDDFLGAEGFAVLIANPAACAESISLHRECFRAVYLDRTHDCARWLQSIDRIHRLGLPEGVTVEIHAPKATLGGAAVIDQLVADALARKETRMKELLNDAELRGSGLENQDTLKTAEGSSVDLDEILRYLLGEVQASI